MPVEEGRRGRVLQAEFSIETAAWTGPIARRHVGRRDAHGADRIGGGHLRSRRQRGGDGVVCGEFRGENLDRVAGIIDPERLAELEQRLRREAARPASK